VGPRAGLDRCGKSRPHQDSIPDRPARSQSLYGLSYPAHHLHIMGLINNVTCRKCGTEEETSVHILCQCEALASLRHIHLVSFF
jgi:hypothetical protein